MQDPVMENTMVPNSTSVCENPESGSGLSTTSGNIFYLIVQCVIFLFGVPGNFLILRVYWTKTLKTSTHVFIMALAWADLAVCILAVHRIYDKAADIVGYEVPEFTFLIWAVETIAVATSIMMTAVIAADRYDCVCRPHRRFFTHKRGKITAWAAFVFSLILDIPAFLPRAIASGFSPLGLWKFAFRVIFFLVALLMITLCYGKVYMTIKKHARVGVKGTTRDCSVSRLADEWSTRLQDSVVTNVELKVPTVASMSSFISKPCSSTVADASTTAQSKGASRSPNDETTLDESGRRRANQPQATLSKQVLVSKDSESRLKKRSNDPRQHQDSGGRPVPKADGAVLQRKTTRMLFITSVVFLLTWLPFWVRVIGTFGLHYHPVFTTILNHLYVTLYLNNAVNPLIYGLANRRFRKDCKTVLSKMKFC